MMLMPAGVIYWRLLERPIVGLAESIRDRTGEDYFVYLFMLEVFKGVIDYRVQLAFNCAFEWASDGLD